MMSNAISCSNWRLYVIVDGAACAGRDPAWIAEQAIRGGADAIQLRDKSASAAELVRQARRLLAVTRPAGIPLIINDRADVAAAIGADGAHLGQDDVPAEAARAILGPDRIIGQSTHSLEQAKGLGDVLIVALNSDRSVRALKGPARPVVRQDDRALVLAALSCVDYVTIFDERTPQRLITELKPDVLVKGADWSAQEIVGAEVVRRSGGRVVRVQLVNGYSTTKLVQRIGQGAAPGS